MLVLTALLLSLLLRYSSPELTDAPSCPAITPLNTEAVCGTGDEFVCYTEREPQNIEVSITFTNLCESSICPVSQLNPVLARSGDSLSLSFSEEPFFRLPMGLSVFSFSSQQAFITCDVSMDYDQLVSSESHVLNATLPSQSLSSGINYLTFSTDISCVYLRMVVNVQRLDCAPLGSDALCSGVGVCAASTDPFSEAGFACVCPQPEGAAYRDSYCSDLDECSSYPCQNGGNCTEGGVCGFSCECPPGFSGTLCEDEIVNVCDPNPCTEGTCVPENATSFRCICPPWITGDICDEKVNKCLPNPCQNSAVCVNLTDGFSCNCLMGYTGQLCEIPINYCNHSLCMGGDCVNVVGGYVCVCPPEGRVDATCGCHSGVCEDRGVCTDDTGYAMCTCDSGFSGVRCETDIDLCQIRNPCSEYGMCQETTDNRSTICVCESTHTDVNCSTPIDPCFGVTCNSRGDCVSGNDSYTCECLPGYSGGSCEVLDPCSASPCANTSLCVNATNPSTGDQFQCICPAGVTGRACETPITCDPNPCNNGTCVTDEITGRIMCICPYGVGGVYCERELDIVTPRFKGTQSYLGFAAPYLQENSGLRIRFRASQPDGIILFGSQSPAEVGDYILVQMSQGIVSVWFDCGFGEMGTRVSDQLLDDDTYHILDISIDSCRVELGVNSWHSSAVSTKGTNINLGGVLYVGGVPDSINLPPNAETVGLYGCISGVEIGESSLPLDNPLEGNNVENCEENVCQGVYCSNGGRCVHSSTNKTGYSCICADGAELESCGLPACLRNPCMHGGQCLMRAGQPVCVCQPFFNGSLCELKSPRMTFFSGTQHSYVKYGLGDQELVSLSLTVRPNASSLSGVLVYTSERQEGLGDYLLLALSGGYPVLQWDLGSGQGLLSSPVNLKADTWYRIQVTRSGPTTAITVDENPTVTSNSSGPFIMLGAGSSLYVGGVPSLSFISFLAAALGLNGFTGCIEEFEATSKSGDSVLTNSGGPESGSGVSMCGEDPCVPSPCQNGAGCVSAMGGTSCICPPGYTGLYCSSLLEINDCSSQLCEEGATCVMIGSGPQCLCPLGKTGDRCGQNIQITYPSFTKSPFAYMQYSILGLEDVMNMSLEFNTQSRYGLLLFTSQSQRENPGDFLSLAVFEGKVELRWNLGSGVGILQWPEPLVLSEWYAVEVRRTARWGELSVGLLGSSAVTPISGYSQGTLRTLNSDGVVYVGGADSYVRTATSSGVAAGLNGCVRDLTINGRRYSQSEASAGIDVESCSAHPCLSHSCAAGSTCEPSADFTSYTCACSIPQIGELCEEIAYFENASFSGDSYAVYLFESDPITTEIRLSIRLMDSEGLVLWVGREGGDSNGDYLSIGVRAGQIQGSIDLGSGIASWSFPTNINDTKWHTLSLRHQNNQLDVTLNDDTQNLTLPGGNMHFNPSGGLWVGGHSDTELVGFPSGLKGCVSGLILSERLIDLDTEVLMSRNVFTCDS